jgi:hypothetical protein
MLLGKGFGFALLIWISAIAARSDLTITQQVQKEAPPEGADVTMTMKIKEQRMRLDLNPQVSSIVDLKTGDMISLMHPQKLAMTIPGSFIKSLQQRYAQEAIKNAAGNSMSPKSTGRKETIGGYACEEFETTASGLNVRLWVTKDLPNTPKLLAELSSLAGANPFRGLAGDQQLPGFPIRTVLEGPGSGKTIVTVIELNEGPIAVSEFEIPEGYRTMQAPAIPLK